MSSRSTDAPSPIIRQAAEWAALLDSGEATRQEQAACEAWCDADPAHRATFERMWQGGHRLAARDALEQRALRHLLGGERRRTGRATGAALGLALLAAAGWGLWSSDAVRDRFPDAQTAPGTIQALALADGSQLTLDTATRARWHLEPRRRAIRLIAGRLMAEVAHDPSRPFVVDTSDGSATALGTAFTVSRDEAGTVVAVVRSHVRACATDVTETREAPCLTLGPGQRALLARGAVTPLPPLTPDAIAEWTGGWLEVDDREVGEVIAALNRYRAQPVAFDAGELRGLRVTGSFPLTDSEQALEGLARTPGLALTRDADGSLRLVRRR